jgi:hypothetical protein
MTTLGLVVYQVYEVPRMQRDSACEADQRSLRFSRSSRSVIANQIGAIATAVGDVVIIPISNKCNEQDKAE